MKKTMKKLVLNRETLTGLENGLENVAGGLTQVHTSCASGGRNTCGTCVLTCTTVRC